MKRSWRFTICVAFVAFLHYGFLGSASPAGAAEYQWDFAGNLNSSLGPGTLTYADASTQALTTFNTTDGSTVPHIGGESATYMHVPAFSQLSEGYNLELTATGPNGGGAYVNQYTMVLDLLVPNDINWTPLFNTSFENANDADMYIAPDGAIGIAALGYTDVNVVVPNTWYRVAIAVDLGAGRAAYYLNGSPMFELSSPSLLDGRFALYSNADPGHDLRLFNEGDESGQYTHDLYVNSLYFTDRELSASEVFAHGGPTAEGIAETVLEGDYNGDGMVDAADYLVWRNTLGQTGAGLAADGNKNLAVDAGDYTFWKERYGYTSGGTLFAASSSMVPEPPLMGLSCVVLATWLVRVRRR